MTEVVVLAERVATSIALGESHFREFKSGLEGPPGSKVRRDLKEVSRDICSTLVGFANADGGELLVGVEDNGEVTGLEVFRHDNLSFLLDCWKDGVHKNTPLQSVKALQVTIEHKTALYFSVPKSTSSVHLTADGKCLQRRDLETAPISSEDITFSRQERKSQEYDREFIDGASADALDLSVVRVLAEQISAGMSAEKCLQYLELADFSPSGLRLRKAALLLFASDPKRWHPRLQIRILKVAGTELQTGIDYNAVKDEYVEGNVISLIDSAWTALRPHLVQTRFTGSARFENSVIYPELACREALINAIAHRDYSQEGRGIEIYVFDDRMEVRSPGGLLSSISVEDLKNLSGAHQSRNAFIARVLRELGYMREVGEGMRRIFELMQSNELAEPDIVTTPDHFSVSLKNQPLYKKEHLIWLDSFSETELDRRDKATIVLGYGGKEFSPNDIFHGLGLVDTEEYRKVVDSLQTKGILVSVKTRSSAALFAKRNKINVRDVPRFAIQVPGLRSTPSVQPRKSHPKLDPETAPPAENYDPNGLLFVGNVRGPLTKAELLKFVWDCGVDGDVILPAKARSYFLVRLSQPELAEAAIGRLDGQEYAGFAVVARRDRPRTA